MLAPLIKPCALTAVLLLSVATTAAERTFSVLVVEALFTVKLSTSVWPLLCTVAPNTLLLLMRLLTCATPAVLRLAP